MAAYVNASDVAKLLLAHGAGVNAEVDADAKYLFKLHTVCATTDFHRKCLSRTHVIVHRETDRVSQR